MTRIHEMKTAVDSRLLPGKEAALYSTCSHGTNSDPVDASYIRNPLFWGKDLDFSFHSVAEWSGSHYWHWVDNAWVDAYTAYTPNWNRMIMCSLITPRHVITCAHSGRSGVYPGEGPDGLGRTPDTVMRFITADGQIEQRRAMWWMADPGWGQLANADWQVGVLESDITTIKPVKFLPDDYALRFPDDLVSAHIPVVHLTNRYDVENIHYWSDAYNKYIDTPLPFYHSSPEARISDLGQLDSLQFAGGYLEVVLGTESLYASADAVRNSLAFRVYMLPGDSGCPGVLLTPEGPVIIKVESGGQYGIAGNLIERKAAINQRIRELDIAVNGVWSGYKVTQADLVPTIVQTNQDITRHYKFNAAHRVQEGPLDGFFYRKRNPYFGVKDGVVYQPHDWTFAPGSLRKKLNESIDALLVGKNFTDNAAIFEPTGDARAPKRGTTGTGFFHPDVPDEFTHRPVYAHSGTWYPHGDPQNDVPIMTRSPLVYNQNCWGYGLRGLEAIAWDSAEQNRWMHATLISPQHIVSGHHWAPLHEVTFIGQNNQVETRTLNRWDEGWEHYFNDFGYYNYPEATNTIVDFCLWKLDRPMPDGWPFVKFMPIDWPDYIGNQHGPRAWNSGSLDLFFCRELDFACNLPFVRPNQFHELLVDPHRYFTVTLASTPTEWLIAGQIDNDLISSNTQSGGGWENGPDDAITTPLYAPRYYPRIGMAEHYEQYDSCSPKFLLIGSELVLVALFGTTISEYSTKRALMDAAMDAMWEPGEEHYHTTAYNLSAYPKYNNVPVQPVLSAEPPPEKSSMLSIGSKRRHLIYT